MKIDTRQYLLTFNKFQQNRELHFAPKIKNALLDQIKPAAQALKQGASLSTASNLITSAPITASLRPLYIDAGVVYGAAVRATIMKQKARMPIGFSERMTSLMVEYFQTNILNTAEEITTTTRELLQGYFLQSVREGWSISQMVAKMEDIGFNRVRARLIARTETVTAANRGGLISAKETGLEINKQWLAAYDDRTRNSHLYANGQTVPIDELFTLSGSVKMEVPGDRGGKDGRLKTPAGEIINCRCTCLYIPV